MIEENISVLLVWGMIGALSVVLFLSVIDYKISLKKKKQKVKELQNHYPKAFQEQIKENKPIDEYSSKELSKLLSITEDDWDSKEREILKKEERKRINKLYNCLKNRYPHGLSTYEKIKTWKSFSRAELIEKEAEFKKYEEYHQKSVFFDTWEKEQKQFTQRCKNVLSSSLNGWGRYSYEIEFPRANSRGKAQKSKLLVTQSFARSFCLESDLDYSLLSGVKEANSLLPQLKEMKSCFLPEVYDKLINALLLMGENITVLLAHSGLEEGWKALNDYHFDYFRKKCAEEDISCLDILDLPHRLNHVSRNFVVIDLITTNENLRSTCSRIITICQNKKSCINYVSLCKGHDRPEIMKRINKAEEKNKLKSALEHLKIAARNQDVEGAQKMAGYLEQNKNKDKELSEVIDNEIKNFSSSYQRGLVDNWGKLYVSYNAPEEYIQKGEWQYAVAKFPEKGTLVFPYRRREIARRGYLEKSFQTFLSEHLSSNLQILGDVNILPSDDNRPYEPDIAIIDRLQPSVRVDIEIDEPYTGIGRKPIHYIGCGDDFRDRNLTNIGWIVIRFSEWQVLNDAKGCASLVAKIMCALNPEILFPESLKDRAELQPQKRWSETEARVMSVNRLREKYLGHEFKRQEDEKLTLEDIKQSEEERRCAKEIKPLTVVNSLKDNSLIKKGLRSGTFAQDDDIEFFPEEHIYLYKGKYRFIPVSSLVSHFFSPFDSMYWSKRKARQRAVPQGQVLEEWDAKGAISREVGTFLHLQIENYFNDDSMAASYPFKYQGQYVNCDEEVSIKIEIMQFKHFLQENTILPFRTEWSIYDKALKIAGTIDLICKDDSGYSIYDWKRSSKVLDYNGNPIIAGVYQSLSINGLNLVVDTSYNRYCIQQNLYRYILEKNYNLKINKMYLVVFLSSLKQYKKLEVPRMDKAIGEIITACENGMEIEA